MSLGVCLRVAEIIVTTYCGVKLVVNMEKPRWDHVAARILFWLLVWLWAGVTVSNLQFIKYSPMEYMIASFWYWILSMIFFEINPWVSFVRNQFCWQNLMYLRSVTVLFCSMQLGMPVMEYTLPDREWHWFHVVMIAVTMAGILLFFGVMREKQFIRLKKHRHAMCLTCLLMIMSFVYDRIVFANDYTMRTPTAHYLMACTLAVWLFVTLTLCVLFAQNYFEMNWHLRAIQNHYEQVYQQYLLLDMLYQEKRRQVHDALQQNTLLTGYLEHGQMQEALQYLAEIRQSFRRTATRSFSNIPVIDCMLNYKMQMGENWRITFEIVCDVLKSPLPQNDMCILLGNLLDNAMEAVQNLGTEERNIRVVLRQINHIFVLKIRNPYQGKRIITDGRYQTTKQKHKKQHGIGLESVGMIVEQAEGIFEIDDDGHWFEVTVTLFKKQARPNEQSKDYSSQKHLK